MSVLTKKLSRIKWDLKNIERAKRRSANKAIRDSLGLIRIVARQDTIPIAYGSRGKGNVGKTSRPGKPPFAHSPEGIRTIAWAYNYKTQSGIVGPVIRQTSGVGVKNAVTAPNALEYGSRMTIKQVKTRNRDGSERWVRVTRRNIRRNRWKRKRSRTVNVQKRPFMVPTMERLAKEGRLAETFKGTFQ